jgi:hypothetical protein
LKVNRRLVEHVASIFMVEEYANQETSVKVIASTAEDGGSMLLRKAD